METTLKYSSTTFQQQLPYGLEIDYKELCELVSSEGPEKPTHVVSEVVYGLNGYMQFTKKFRYTYLSSRKLKNTHCSKLKMNGKKLSQFQLHFPGLLGTSPMS